MKKRIVSFVLALMMCFSLSMTAFAAEANQLTDQEFIASKISELIPAFLTATEFGVTEENYENLYVGNPITAYTYTNGENTGSYLQYPIIFENLHVKEIIGLARVIEHENGERTIDYGVNCAPQIQDYLETSENTSFALLYSENGVSIATASSQTMVKVYETTSLARMNAISLEEVDYALTDLEAIEKIEVPTATFATRAVEHNSLNIEHISQGGTTCWAACVACIMNYYYGTDFDSLDVLLQASDAGIITTGSSGLTISETKLVFESYTNEYGISCTKKPTYFSYSTLKSYINDDTLFWARGSKTTGSGAGHAIVPYGYYYSGSGSKYMYYMEPNTGLKTAAFPSSGAIVFTNDASNFALDSYLICYQ